MQMSFQDANLFPSVPTCKKTESKTVRLFDTVVSILDRAIEKLSANDVDGYTKVVSASSQRCLENGYVTTNGI
jgi:hypothetical protein